HVNSCREKLRRGRRPAGIFRCRLATSARQRRPLQCLLRQSHGNSKTILPTAGPAGLAQTTPEARPSVREPEHLMLARPHDRRVEQAGDADPCGRRASAAALTRIGARKASEIVMLTWRLLQASRPAIPSTVAAPASISDNHCRPRAMAVTSLTRV